MSKGSFDNSEEYLEPTVDHKVNISMLLQKEN